MIAIPAPMQAPAGLRNPFTDADWVYEIKQDGYRCMAGIEEGRVKLQTKAGSDCTAWFPEVSAALAKLPGGPHVIDGEACVLDEHGVADFNRLQERARKRRLYPGAPRVTLMAFDILVHHGKRVMELPLLRRKHLLEELLASQPKVHLLYVSDVPADARVVWALLGAGLQVEGVMAKRKASTYQPGVRSADWVKIKRPGWQEGRSWRS